MSRAQILYLGPGGRFRLRWTPMRQTEPVSLVNVKDGQLHILSRAPFFVKETPAPLVKFWDLLTMPPPIPSPVAEDVMLLCEEDNPWPVGVVSEPLAPEEQLRQLQDQEQEWTQKTKGRARTRSNNDLSPRMANAMVAVTLVLGGVIAAIGVALLIDSRRAEEPVAMITQVIQKFVG